MATAEWQTLHNANVNKKIALKNDFFTSYDIKPASCAKFIVNLAVDLYNPLKEEVILWIRKLIIERKIY